MATTGNVTTLGSLHEEKKGKSKQPLPVPLDGVISKPNLETEKENVASQIQNNQIEGNTEIQALKESEMHDSVLEGALLFRSCPIQGGVIDENILSDELKNGKKRKLKKRKQIIESDLSGSHQGEQMDANGRQDDSMAAVTQGTHTENVNRLDEQPLLVPLDGVISKPNLETEKENVVSQIQNNQIEGNTEIQALKESEMHDSVLEGALLFKSCPIQGGVIDENILSDKLKSGKKRKLKKRKQIIESDLSGSHHGEQMDANGRQDDIMAAVTQGTHTENVNRLDEQSSSTINKEPIKLDSLQDQNCAKNVGNLFDVATDQVVQIPGDHGQKKRKRGKKNKSANSNLAEPKEEIRFPNHIAEGRDGDSVVSTKGIMSVAAESIHLETDNPSNEKLVVKNDECVEHVIPTSGVAVSDRTQMDANGRQNDSMAAVTQGTHTENVNRLDEQSSSTINKEPIKLDSLQDQNCAKNVGNLFDVATDQVLQIPGGHGLKKRKRGKKNKSANSNLAQPKEEIRFPNHIAEGRDGDSVVSTKGIMSVAAESIHLETDNPSNEKLVVKNAECVEHVIPTSGVAVSDRTQMDANGRQNDSMAAVTQGTHTENVNRLDEQSSSTINKEPIKLDSLQDQNCAKNVGNLFDVATDQVLQIPGGHGLKKRKRGKKNKSANSNLAQPKEEIRFPNHIAEGRDGDSVVSTKGIMSVAAESIHLETDNPSNEKLVVKNDECVEHVIPTSEVAVSDGTQNIKISKSKRKKMQGILSSMSQPELKEENVLPTKGIVSVAAKSIHLETDNPSNEKLEVKNDECVKHVIPMSEVAVSDGTQNIKISKSKKKRMQRKLSNMSQLELKDEALLSTQGIVSIAAESIHLETDNPSNEKLEAKNDECVEHVIPTSEVAVSDGTQNIKIGKSKRKTMQRKLSSMSQSKLKEEHESTNFTMQPSSLNDQHVTAVQEGIVNMPCVVTTKTTPNMTLHDTLAALPVQQGEMRASSICADHVDVGGTIAISEAVHAKTLDPSLERNHFGSPRRKLLILDINGLLADIVAPPIPSGYIPDIRVSRKAVFRRPFCESFLQFCFKRFDVGVWSSRVKQNLNMVIDFLMRGLANKLLFCWNRSHCTTTKFPSIENKHKPMVMKELKRLWEKPSHAAWEKGKYDQSNTLLVDDSPYKALRNPADTGIFPLPYQYTDVNDCSLGPGGDLRVYLERLAMADNVPEFVRNNPYGQRPIRETNLSWKYYKKML
ncbi:hypothetical protein QQ045_007392 [Rhodiola kirilowii]